MVAIDGELLDLCHRKHCVHPHGTYWQWQLKYYTLEQAVCVSRHDSHMKTKLINWNSSHGCFHCILPIISRRAKENSLSLKRIGRVQSLQRFRVHFKREANRTNFHRARRTGAIELRSTTLWIFLQLERGNQPELIVHWFKGRTDVGGVWRTRPQVNQWLPAAAALLARSVPRPLALLCPLAPPLRARDARNWQRREGVNTALRHKTKPGGEQQ